MHAHKTKVTISDDHELAVKLPEDFPSGRAEVIVLAENGDAKTSDRAGESPEAFIARGTEEGWLRPPTERFTAPPPRRPVAPLARILAELERDREDR